MRYQVWREGIRINESENSAADFVGEVEANSFKEACDKLFFGSKTYEPNSLSDWGCRLFDNEADARKYNG